MENDINKYKMQIEALEAENKIMKKNIANYRKRKVIIICNKISKIKRKVLNICKRKK